MSNFADIIVVPAAGAVFNNTRKGDLTIFTESSNQHIHIGPSSAAHSAVTVTSSTVRVGASIVPLSNEVYDLGASNARFRDLYLSGSTIDLGGTKISTNAQGGFELRDNSNNSIAVFKKPLAASSNYFVFDPQVGNIQLFDPLTQQVSSAISGGGSVAGLSNAPGAVYTLQGSNLGVGTSNPQSLLHVAGNARIDGDIQLATNRNLHLTRIKVFKTAAGQSEPANITSTITSVPGIAPTAPGGTFDFTFPSPATQSDYRFFDNSNNVAAQIDQDGMTVRRRLRIT